MTKRVLHCPPRHSSAIILAAAEARPAECCGLLEGDETPDGWRIFAVHQTANLADDPQRRFLIDPQAQFRLLRDLRGSGRGIIGCFHSHPLGPGEPSATDLAEANEPDFVWLIAGGEPDRFVLNAFLFTGGRFEPLVLHPTE